MDCWSWWWTGMPGMLQSMKSQRVSTTEWLNWTELNWSNLRLCKPPKCILSSATGTFDDFVLRNLAANILTKTLLLNWLTHCGMVNLYQWRACLYIKSCQSCLTLCDTMGCSPLGSSKKFSRQNTGVCCHALLLGIFSNQGPNPWLSGLLHYQVDSLPLLPHGKPIAATNTWLFLYCSGALLFTSKWFSKTELRGKIAKIHSQDILDIISENGYLQQIC